VKARLAGALAGFVISLVLPTFAQQANTPDPQLRQQLDALLEKTDDAYINNDPAAAATLFTEDAVLVTPDNKTFHGREAIEKYYGDLFKEVHFSKHLLTVDRDSAYIITAGNVMWETGECSMTYQGQTGGPTQAKGYWSAIFSRDGETWKKRSLMVAEEKIL
jgi:uncharacterized protein (TIGR02246 family)